MKKTLYPGFVEEVTSKGKPRAEIYDIKNPGLILRVSDTGRKVWDFLYTSPADGKRTRFKIGSYPAIDLDAARAKAQWARAQVDNGHDPHHVVALTQAAERASRNRMTITKLCALRLKKRVDGKLRTADDVRRRYKKYIIAHVGRVLVEDFAVEPHYNKCIDALVDQGKLRQAGVVHTDLVGLMNFAIARGVRPSNPLIATETPDPKNVRERWLTVPEIATFWRELPKAIKWSKIVPRILMLCLVTGQRVGEVCGMARSEVDRANALWTIPKERVKNGTVNVVPLSRLALLLIQEAWDRTNNEYLFPNDEGDGPLNPEVVASTLRRSHEAGDWTLAKFTPHDLRRTVGTEMLNRANGLGITRMEKYLVLNHQSALNSNVSDSVYDHNDYLDEKREALVKWGDFIAKLVGVELEEREAA